MQKMKVIAAIPVCLAIMLGSIARGASTKQTSNRFENELQPYIEHLMRTQEIPGMAIVVVQGGHVVYAHGFGVKTLNPAVIPTVFPEDTHTAGPVTTKTLFHMASITKTFVAAAVMQLVNMHKIDLDAPVIKYLPQFEMADPRYKAITVRQLLEHTSGIPDRSGIKGHGWDHPEMDDQALARFVSSLKAEKLNFAPGTRFQYSNTGYNVLGDMIAQVSGESFETYIQSHILTPLRMKDSSLLLERSTRNLLATGHETNDAEDPMAMDIFPFNRTQSADGGLESNASDMARYAMANLNRGELNGQRILPTETYEALWKPAVKAGDGPFANYGLGWYVGTFEGLRIVSHTGKDLGFMSDLALLPDQHIAVVWMMNAGWADRSLSITDAVLNIALGRPMQKVDVRRDLPAVLAGDLARGKSIEWVKEKYFTLRKTKPDNFNFEEQRLDVLGDYLMQRHKLNDAVEIYRMNAEVYPASAHALEKLGDAQTESKQKAAAMASYEAALKIEPSNMKVEEKLTNLKDSAP